MSWRIVVVSSSAKLDYQLGFLVVRKETVKKIYLNEISMLILESTAISLTAALVSELIKRKIKLIFCDERRNPCGEVIPYYGSHDTSIKIKNQIGWKEESKQEVWTEIVVEKIKKQRSFLYELDLEAYKILDRYLEEIQFADASNREGHAAKVYFNALFGTTFTRMRECPVNAALNYGYSIILSAFNREIVSNGYITPLGILHENRFNPFNLASDLMEPYRILVDRKVYELKLTKFEQKEKREMVDILNQEVIIAERKEYVNQAIKIYTKSIFDALNEGDCSLIRFYQNEL